MKLKVDNVVIEIDEDDIFQLISLLAESYSINAYLTEDQAVFAGTEETTTNPRSICYGPDGVKYTYCSGFDDE